MGTREEVPAKEYVKDTQRVMMTTNSLKAHYRVEERTQAMTQFAETTPLNRMEMGEDTSIGIITSSTSYQYVREVFGDKACVLKLGLSWPMPVEKIRTFAAQVDKVLVVEELEPIIENHCRQIGWPSPGRKSSLWWTSLLREEFPAAWAGRRRPLWRWRMRSRAVPL